MAAMLKVQLDATCAPQNCKYVSTETLHTYIHRETVNMFEAMPGSSKLPWQRQVSYAESAPEPCWMHTISMEILDALTKSMEDCTLSGYK